MSKERKIGDQKDVNLWDELHPNRFLKAGLLGCKPATVVIERVYVEVMAGTGKKEGTTEDKAIVSFVGKDREMALNRTNRESLRALFGSNVTAWLGQRVTLVVDQDRDPTNGGKCDCIRVAGSPDMAANTIEAVWTVHSPKGARRCSRMLYKTGASAPTVVGRVAPAATIIDDPYRPPPMPDPDDDGRTE